MTKPILLAIVAYQRFISPYKGFRCAFHAHTGRGTCSGYGYRVFARYGSVRGWRLLRRRFADCRVAAQLESSLHNGSAGEAPVRKLMPSTRQGGFVDCGGCDMPGCDLPDCGKTCDLLGNIADISDCCSRKNKSCREWDCADVLGLLFILAVIAGLVYLAYRFYFR